MLHKNLVQRRRLLGLARLILARKGTLGIGLRNQCWAGLAIEVAGAHGSKVTEYYGLPMRKVKQAIKLNNKMQPSVRNIVMAGAALFMALS